MHLFTSKTQGSAYPPEQSYDYSHEQNTMYHSPSTNHEPCQTAQPTSYNHNSLSDNRFDQNQGDYIRGDNPRNSHGTRLRPVSELRMSYVPLKRL